jgi:hypothetical protein
LVAWIVDNLNGELEFRDNEPRGSVVTVRLAAASAPDQDPACDDEATTAD